MGLLLGVLLAVGARAGSRPKRTARELLRPIGVLMGDMATLALVARVSGFVLARNHSVWLVDPLAEAAPPERHDIFLADLWAHNAADVAGGLGGLVLSVRTFILRGRTASPSIDSLGS